jgi:F-type H+-transporting ATPase subunit a
VKNFTMRQVVARFGLGGVWRNGKADVCSPWFLQQWRKSGRIEPVARTNGFSQNAFGRRLVTSRRQPAAGGITGSMRLLKSIFTLFLLVGVPSLALAAAKGDAPAVSPEAPTVFELGPIPITNAMIYTWIIMAIIFAVVFMATRQMKLVPSGLQNLVESLVEGLENVTKGLLEPKVVRWVFPLVATFFLFILTSNLMGLVPGVGSIGFGVADPESPWPRQLHHADIPLFRPPTADANTTVALALIFFVMSMYWAVKYNGPFGLFKHIFGVKGGLTGWLALALIPIFFFVGLIEVISIAIRPVALAMRLYGNIYGGESVLTIMLGMAGGLAAVPFYFLELIVGIVQALVFTLLAIAFIGTLCSHPEEEGAHH